MRVRFTSKALTDLSSILDYIAEQSPNGAKRIQARIKAIIDLLPEYPAIGSRTDDPLIRRMPTTPYPYLVFYEVGADEIVVHAIRHGARDPGDSLGFERPDG